MYALSFVFIDDEAVFGQSFANSVLTLDASTAAEWLSVLTEEEISEHGQSESECPHQFFKTFDDAVRYLDTYSDFELGRVKEDHWYCMLTVSNDEGASACYGRIEDWG